MLLLHKVLGPNYDPREFGDPENGESVAFGISGGDRDEVEAVRRRILKYVEGELEGEMNATQEELEAAGMAQTLDGDGDGSW